MMNPVQQDPEILQEFETPAVNICETKDEVIVEAEMPGVDKNRLEVRTEGHELVIIGHRRHAEESGEILFQEIPRSDFQRVFTLGDYIKASDIKASFKDGILTLRIPKSEEVKPRKIEVQFA